MLNVFRVLGHDLLTLGRIACGSATTSAAHPQLATLIETSAVCNLRCPLCPTGNRTLSRSHRFVDPAQFSRMVELTYDISHSYTLSMWGEPMINPGVFELLDQVRGKPVWLSSNLNFDSAIAERLRAYDNVRVICSVDGYDQETYAAYRRGGDFALMLRNLGILTAGRGRAYAQFLVDGQTPAQTARMRDIARQAGCAEEDILLKPMNMNFSNLAAEHGRKACHSTYYNVFFSADGMQVPCCRNFRPDLHIRHVSEIRDTADLLNGAQVMAMRRQLSRNASAFASCRACTGPDDYAAIARQHLTDYARATGRALGRLTGGASKP